MLHELQERFSSCILPAVQTHGRISFRHRDTESREEAVAEMVAVAWKWFLRLDEQGKDATQFPHAFAGFVAKAVKSGRKLTGMDGARDILSPRAQRIHAFYAQTLPQWDSAEGEGLKALTARGSVPSRVAFRLDYRQFLGGLSAKDRLLAVLMASEETTTDLAAAFKVSLARVSQKRREFLTRWREMHAGEV